MTQLTAKPFTARPFAARPFTAYPFGESTSVSNPLVWHAAYPDSDGVMQAQLKGSGTPSFTVDDGLLLPDFEGIYRTTAEDTPPWHGARKVTNLLVSAPVTGVGSVTLTSGQADPEGGATAVKVVYGAASSGSRAVYSAATGGSAHHHLLSVWIKGAVGGEQVKLWTGWSGQSPTITLTTSWRRYSFSYNEGATQRACSCLIYATTGTPTIYTAFAQSEEAAGRANTTSPSEFIANPSGPGTATKYFSYENGNTVSSNVVTEAQGATLDPLPSLYGAPAYTNSLTYSNDLTNAAWVKAGSPTIALNANGLTGAPNTATTITDGNAGATAIAYKQIAVTANTDTNSIRYFIKKDTDTTRFPLCIAEHVGGNYAGYHLNTQTGATTAMPGSHASGAVSVTSVGDWWEVVVSCPNNSRSTFIAGAYPADATVAGTRSAAATGSIIVGNVELHLNKTIAAVRGSAPIITAASTVTTTAISMSYDIANHSDEKGAYYAENKYFGYITGNEQGAVTLSASGRLLTHNNINWRSYDGTQLVNGPAPVVDTWQQLGLSYGDSLQTFNVDGTNGTEGAYDGSYAAGAAIYVNAAFNGTTAPNTVRLIRNIRRYSLNYTAAKAKITELMLDLATFQDGTQATFTNNDQVEFR